MNDGREDIETRRRRLLWRAGHRGMRELDLVLDGFARANIPHMGAEELAAFEAVVEMPDPDLYDILLGSGTPAPGEANPMLARVLAFRPVVGVGS